MSKLFATVFFFLGFKAICQDSITIPSKSIFSKLGIGDSLTWYQCHVEEAVQQMSTASGQTISGEKQKYSITEKYVIKKVQDGYEVNYYTASLNVFPNRKFSGLKIREKSYWGFKKERHFRLQNHDLKVLLVLEERGREAMEYDYAITKHTTNQIIIKRKKDFKQLVYDQPWIVSRLIKS